MQVHVHVHRCALQFPVVAKPGFFASRCSWSVSRPLPPKVGLAAAALFCLATVVLLGGTTGAEDRETLRQRNTELGRLIFQQRTELERCHTSVAILTERLGKPTPGPPGTNPAAPT